MYKQDLAFNNLQWLICHETQPNQTRHCWKTEKTVVDESESDIDHSWNTWNNLEEPEK